ncbi:MAG: hypothetical protein JGK30_02755 [Microcoleus sp. PH2017_40_RAT_O_B]|nr:MULTISPECIES: hypothetical protein [unclassified Microcoleus]MCC3490026.1 hypothetical protein [Microcoleus sp. PH2017_16_JOR_D_A]MCC3570284.1 hypothetical protein [Microcoleus sp. PH2017_34_RAT_O_A]MCC3608446.1 hypothetical protein [Microcoleus sp. PH2017_40_RAT_O_B]
MSPPKIWKHHQQSHSDAPHPISRVCRHQKSGSTTNNLTATHRTAKRAK